MEEYKKRITALQEKLEINANQNEALHNEIEALEEDLIAPGERLLRVNRENSKSL